MTDKNDEVSEAIWDFLKLIKINYLPKLWEAGKEGKIL